MKVAWICHFYNEEFQSILHPGIRRSELAAWMPQFAELFENEDTFELHIISLDAYIPIYKHIKLRGIHYHFYNSTISFFGYGLLDLFYFNERSGFFINKLFIRYLIRKIKPDIIHLFGAESAYYSSSILQFRRKYPVLITIQGFISKTNSTVDYWLRTRISVEKKILSNFKHFAHCTKSVAVDILKFNPKAVLHFHDYPVPKIQIHLVEKEYDIVFFGRICMDKGFDDLVKAASKIKLTVPDLKICVIGMASDFYKSMVDQFGLSNNFHWTGYLPKLEDVHKKASYAKITVLPTYHDTIPGTIIESMFLRIPVVAYSTGGIPEVNANEECLCLVEVGDVKTLADKISWLLANPKIREIYSERAYHRGMEMFDNSKIIKDIINAYNIVNDDFTSKF